MQSHREKTITYKSSLSIIFIIMCITSKLCAIYYIIFLIYKTLYSNNVKVMTQIKYTKPSLPLSGLVDPKELIYMILLVGCLESFQYVVGQV